MSSVEYYKDMITLLTTCKCFQKVNGQVNEKERDHYLWVSETKLSIKYMKGGTDSM